MSGAVIVHQLEPWLRVLQGDVRNGLRSLPADSVHCVVTSPPYWMLRDYNVAGQIGMEATPDEFVAVMVDVFREVRRVLRPDGVCWINLGDSYANGTNDKKSARRDSAECQPTGRRPSIGLKPKDLCGIPWMVALALRADGWYLRTDTIWHKVNAMPESVRDRPARAHEYVFMLTKSKRYFYDKHACREKVTGTANSRGDGINPKARPKNGWLKPRQNESFSGAVNGLVDDKQIRTVWAMSSEPTKVRHFAAFPVKLPARCISLSTSQFGCCAECGAPYKRIVESERVATRPGDKTKISVDRQTGEEIPLNGKPWASAEVGNRDPMRHVTRYVTRGWAKACKCESTAIARPLILDPFHGSGATALACDRLGCSYVGCELNPEYVPYVVERLAIDRARRAANAAGKPRSVRRRQTVGQSLLFGECPQ